MKRPRRPPEYLCKCNEVSRATVEAAIRSGCRTMNEIFDATTAGVGACGGSCRREMSQLLAKIRAEESPEEPPKAKPDSPPGKTDKSK